MIFSTLGRCRTLILQKKNDVRPFFGWLTGAFNQVDMERIKQFGPDRVCAEWILKNGGAVKWVGAKNFLTNYNALPSESVKFILEKIDASGSSISHEGFLHFRGTRISEVTLHDCVYLEDPGLKQLELFLKDTLHYLKVSSCPNISAEGVLFLKDLSNLKTLELKNLLSVKDKENTLKSLKSHLKNCTITSDFESK